MRSALCLALVACLAGCDGVQSTPTPPVQIRTITVDRPVAVPCVNASDIPAMPAKHGSEMTGDARHDLDIASAAAGELRVALDKALALLGACVR